MSGKLDQSLDDIVSSKPRGARRSTRRAARPATSAPAGGIQKNSRPARGPAAAAKPVPARGPKATGVSKIIVSNLPQDVSESQIKEYFQKSVGIVNNVELSYGPQGRSRGVASVLFRGADSANKAFKDLNGLLIDNRPIKVEVVVAGNKVPAPVTLSDRVTQPKGKAQPKTATAKPAKGAKSAAAGPKAATGPTKGRGGKNGRPVKKSAEELDTEMADYFTNGNAEGANGAAAPAAAVGGEAMEDDVL